MLGAGAGCYYFYYFINVSQHKHYIQTDIELKMHHDKCDTVLSHLYCFVHKLHHKIFMTYQFVESCIMYIIFFNDL